MISKITISPERLLAHRQDLPIARWTSDKATHHYARIRAALECTGQPIDDPIGGMDLMIAAHALTEDSVIVTNNAREFHRVPGLAVEAWPLD